jgi:hypothetical protein
MLHGINESTTLPAMYSVFFWEIGKREVVSLIYTMFLSLYFVLAMKVKSGVLTFSLCKALECSSELSNHYNSLPVG